VTARGSASTSYPFDTVLPVPADVPPSPRSLLEGLDDSQRAAVTSPAAPLAILAGAGSGKTRVLTRRIAWQSRERALDPRHVLALTYTRKAAGELRARLARLGVQRSVTAGTFHAIALAQLRRAAADAGRAPPNVLDRKVRLLLPLVGERGREGALVAGELAAEIEWAKARLITPDGYEHAAAAAGRTPPRPAGQVASIYRGYERDKRKRGLVDFDDLIWHCADALERDPEFAAAQRWRFRALFVDEFQDATASQFRLLRAWLGDRADLCVVGDGDQAIYGFAGADADYLVRFTAHFPPDRYPDVATVALGSNYRSSPQVVGAARAVLPRRLAVRAARPDGPSPVITAYPSDDAEARGVARALKATREPGRGWSRLAVLYRVNAQSAQFEEALARENIPFRVRGGDRFLDRPEVQVALDALRKTARAAPGRSFTEHLTDVVTDADMSDTRREHLDALVRLGREYVDAEGGSGSLDGFLTFLRTTLRGDDAEAVAGDAVQLLTFHRAKGLEFDCVFVTGLERGLVPISHAKTAAALDEEQRLLYVALSRAERVLHLSWAETRAVGLRTAKRTPSPWLARVERAVTPDEPDAPTGSRAHIARARARATDARGTGRAARSRAEAAPADAPLLDALFEWRRRLSRAAGVPAYVIFDNSTLAGIASRRPRSRVALLEVSGVGPVKAQRYGDAVLGLVEAHVGSAPAGARRPGRPESHSE
jgi:DNA helicase-2/ATP-dependent DNA helicase PcrA